MKPQMARRLEKSLFVVLEQVYGGLLQWRVPTSAVLQRNLVAAGQALVRPHATSQPKKVVSQVQSLMGSQFAEGTMTLPIR